MKQLVKLVVTIVVMGFLVSCATTEPTQVKPQETGSVDKHGMFDAWDDAVIKNAAVEKLVKQADTMMKYKQWDDAQGKLERTLRVSKTYAPAWSRLSWLSLRAAKYNKAIQLAHRSNTYTDSAELLYLNWQLIRDANKLMGKNNEVEAANKILRLLKGPQL